MEPVRRSGRQGYWTPQLVAERIDQFIAENKRYPKQADLSPALGMPSDCVVRAKLKMGIRQYCEMNYPGLGPEPRTGFDKFIRDGKLMDKACKAWCDSLSEYPDRASGDGFEMFFHHYAGLKFEEHLEALHHHLSPEASGHTEVPEAQQEPEADAYEQEMCI